MSAKAMRREKQAPEWIAERKVILERKDGSRTEVTLRIGKPYEAGKMEWACPVAADGWIPNMRHPKNVDSFAALMQAKEFLRTLMRTAAGDGKRFFDPQDGRELGVDHLMDQGF